MKNTIVAMLILLASSVNFAMAQSNTADRKKTIAVVIVDNSGSLTDQIRLSAKKEVNSMLAENQKYTVINPEHINIVVTNMVGINTNLIYDQSYQIELGKILGAQYLCIIDILKPNISLYSVICSLVDATTGGTIKDNKAYLDVSSNQRYIQIMYLSIQEAASFLAANPEKFKKKITNDIERQKKEINDVAGVLGVKNPHVKNGLEISYVSRSYDIEDVASGIREKSNPWGAAQIDGVQIGLRFDRYFIPKYFGLGVSMGVFGGYYFYDGQTADASVSFKEAVLTIPVQAIYRLDFNKTIGCYARFGVSADIGLYSQLEETAGGGTVTTKNLYSDTGWDYSNRFNYSLVYGLGIQISGVLLEVSQSRGMQNLSQNNEYNILQNKNIQVGMTFMF